MVPTACAALHMCSSPCHAAQGLKGSGWASLPIPAAADAWRKRAAWLYAAEVAATGSSSLPDLRPEQLMSQLDKWLGPHLAGVRIKGQLQQLPWGNIIKSQVSIYWLADVSVVAL